MLLRFMLAALAYVLLRSGRVIPAYCLGHTAREGKIIETF